MRASVVSILVAGSVTMLAVDNANAERPVKNVQASEGATLIPGKTQAHSDSETSASFTKVTSGEIVTTEALYWNGSWGDYDDDGWLDLFVGSAYSSERNYLLHNDRDGTFTLIDDAAMPKIPSNQHGSAWADYDNDGHLDLIVTAGNPEIAHSMLYRNNGDGTFTEMGGRTGLAYDKFGSPRGAIFGVSP